MFLFISGGGGGFILFFNWFVLSFLFKEKWEVEVFKLFKFIFLFDYVINIK